MPKYKTVSSAKMKAWIRPMNMSNSFQTTFGAQNAYNGNQADDRDHDAAGEDVAEETKGQRERLDDLLEDGERQQASCRCGRSP